MRIRIADGSTGTGRAIAEGIAGPDDDVLIGLRSKPQHRTRARRLTWYLAEIARPGGDPDPVHRDSRPEPARA